MKLTLVLSTLMTFLAVGCGAASDVNSASTDNAGASLLASNGPLNCTIQTVNGRYLTAVGGGGRTSDVIHTDATRASAWEKFQLIDSGDGASPIHYGIKTVNGHYLTAVNGGGLIQDVIHSDATVLRAWEKFTLNSLGGGLFDVQTNDGHYVTANNGGGLINDTIHTDATRVGAWEKFRFTCSSL